jgi:hypothetical protein
VSSVRRCSTPRHPATRGLIGRSVPGDVKVAHGHPRRVPDLIDHRPAVAYAALQPLEFDVIAATGAPGAAAGGWPRRRCWLYHEGTAGRDLPLGKAGAVR